MPDTPPANLPFTDVPARPATPSEGEDEPETTDTAPAQLSGTSVSPTEPAPAAKPAPEKEKLPQIVPGMEPIPDLPSIEDLERRSVIKRILLVVVSVIVLAAIGTGLVALVNIFFVKDKIIEPPAPPEAPTAIPATQDTDGDKMPDVWEIRYQFDPKDPTDARRDADLDRLRNVDEFRLKTDPLNEDTDGDGFTDGREVENGYNPNGEGRLTGTTSGTPSGTQPITSGQGGTTTDTGGTTTDDTLSGPVVLAGRWNGTFIGGQITTQQAFFTLQPNGSLTGAFNVKQKDQTISIDISGTYTYDRKTGVFTGTLKGVFIQGRNTDTFTGTLNGQVSKENTAINGTWTIIPKAASIVKQDRGTFGLTKAGDGTN